jgi:hypothetical protein
MDLDFCDDECRVRTPHAPAKIRAFAHMAQNLIKTVPGKELQGLKHKAQNRRLGR